MAELAPSFCMPACCLYNARLPQTLRQNRGNGTKTIGRWVRGLGLTDERLSPNHSWRQTLGRQFGLGAVLMQSFFLCKAPA